MSSKHGSSAKTLRHQIWDHVLRVKTIVFLYGKRGPKFGVQNEPGNRNNPKRGHCSLHRGCARIWSLFGRGMLGQKWGPRRAHKIELISCGQMWPDGSASCFRYDFSVKYIIPANEIPERSRKRFKHTRATLRGTQSSSKNCDSISLGLEVGPECMESKQMRSCVRVIRRFQESNTLGNRYVRFVFAVGFPSLD